MTFMYLLIIVLGLVLFVGRGIKKAKASKKPVCRSHDENCFGDPLTSCMAGYCLIHHTCYCRQEHPL